MLHGRTRLRNSQSGFTIVEVVVSIALLGVILLVVLTPLTGFFGLTQRSNAQVNATQDAQRAIEALRGDWLNATRYEQVCVRDFAPFKSKQLKAEITSLNLNNEVIGTPPLQDCLNLPAVVSADMSPLRRVKISRTDQDGNVLSTLSVEIDRK